MHNLLIRSVKWLAFTIVTKCIFKRQRKGIFLFSWDLWPRGVEETGKVKWNTQTLRIKTEAISLSSNWLTVKSIARTTLKVKITLALSFIRLSSTYVYHWHKISSILFYTVPPFLDLSQVKIPDSTVPSQSIHSTFSNTTLILGIYTPQVPRTQPQDPR